METFGWPTPTQLQELQLPGYASSARWRDLPIFPQEVETVDYAGPSLYCSERIERGYEIFFPEAGKYEILHHWLFSEAGKYEILHHFADIYFDLPGKRIFDVLVEGRMIHRNYIVQQAHGGNIATSILTTQEILDGAITIALRAQFHWFGSTKGGGFAAGWTPNILMWVFRCEPIYQDKPHNIYCDNMRRIQE